MPDEIVIGQFAGELDDRGGIGIEFEKVIAERLNLAIIGPLHPLLLISIGRPIRPAKCDEPGADATRDKFIDQTDIGFKAFGAGQIACGKADGKGALGICCPGCARVGVGFELEPFKLHFDIGLQGLRKHLLGVLAGADHKIAAQGLMEMQHLGIPVAHALCKVRRIGRIPAMGAVAGKFDIADDCGVNFII